MKKKENEKKRGENDLYYSFQKADIFQYSLLTVKIVINFLRDKRKKYYKKLSKFTLYFVFVFLAQG